MKLLTGLDWVSANLIMHYLNIILGYLKGQFTPRSILLIFILYSSVFLIHLDCFIVAVAEFWRYRL